MSPVLGLLHNPTSPPLLEEPLTPFVRFAHDDCSESVPSGGKAESSNPGKQVDVVQLSSLTHLPLPAESTMGLAPVTLQPVQRRAVAHLGIVIHMTLPFAHRLKARHSEYK